MIPAELIKRKRNGEALNKGDLESFIQGYVEDQVPDYQMAALLMAIYFAGMSEEEIFTLVEVMVNSGERMDFSHLSAYVADKHSTGGVGDKVSIILGPLLAAAGLAIPMISGRSLGHTGGTLDKLETIPGFRTAAELGEVRAWVEKSGIAMVGQSVRICPADKRMYALRDVTGTVESIPLICGSIMSKKIAEGIQGLVLDVKTGNGAFMKTHQEARELGTLLEKIGTAFQVKTEALYTSMDQPLGNYAGLWCEVAEAIECLQNRGPEDTLAVTYTLGGKLLLQAGLAPNEHKAREKLQKLIHSGQAYQRFLTMVQNQGGDPAELETTLHPARFSKELTAEKSGIVQSMDTYRIGLATVELGCGRKTTSDRLDPSAGIEFLHKIGAHVKTGQTLLRCFCSHQARLDTAMNSLQGVIRIGAQEVTHSLFID